MKDTLGTLRARIAELGDTWTDEAGTVHERPTAWAYAQSCAALDRWRRRAEVAEAALAPFANYAHALELIAGEDRSHGATNGWIDLDPILGSRGQLLTMGAFRRAAKVVNAVAQPNPSESSDALMRETQESK